MHSSSPPVGRRYGLVGRNGAGKSTLLRALATGQINGTPECCQILHVEQEIIGDDTSVLDAVLGCDVERTELLEEEAHLNARMQDVSVAAAAAGLCPPRTLCSHSTL